MKIKQLQQIADILRRDSILSTSAAGSGHPTSCMSCAEILSVLFFSEMKFDSSNPSNKNNDEFILSKGHAAPILYSALYRAGAIRHNLLTLRSLSSPLEGHPMPRSLPWIKVATGSLGQGLSVGLGMALAAKLSKRSYKTYVLLGDSEMAEGSIYEALQLASHYNLGNLIAILDANRLGQTKQTMLAHDVKTYASRFKSFGWNTIIVNGHKIPSLISALKKSRKSKKPTIIIAKTFKGQSVSFLKNKENWHGKTLDEKQMVKALSEIPDHEMPKIKIQSPKKISPKLKKSKYISPKFPSDQEIATREAYGQALAALAKSDSRILAIDAEVSNSTHSDLVKKKTPQQFIETYIAEQDLIGVSLGLSKKGYKPFASTFSAFLSRAHDQLRMAALSSANFTVCGSHSGVSIGPDGSSQMGLEDISIFRDLPNSTVLYPCDAVSTEKLLVSAANNPGITYIRTSRPKTPIIHSTNESFKIGDFKVIKQSSKDKVVLIGSGITVHESLRAHELLKSKKINTSVIDLYSIKPLNSKKLISFIKSHGKKVVIAEDHFKAGGIGEMLSESLVSTGIKIKHLYVSGIPHSGTMSQLLDKHKINWQHISLAVREIK
ncbi:transketolase [Candidatus Pacearchaeota archaeon]|nr:transketolase [Candidatus Pacearchaeota archaeon]|tara:strand:+ start:4902 stop:6719 length:1818 start_codon:yes stop_codon:yes gene_type:complete